MKTQVSTAPLTTDTSFSFTSQDLDIADVFEASALPFNPLGNDFWNLERTTLYQPKFNISDILKEETVADVNLVGRNDVVHEEPLNQTLIRSSLPLSVQTLSQHQIEKLSGEIPYVCLNPAKVTAQWTVMVYLNGDNNLEQAALDDFLEMSGVGSTNNVNIVVLLDRIPNDPFWNIVGYSTDYGNWTGTQAGLINLGDLPFSNWGNDWGEMNLGDPDSLVDFVNAATYTFPANNYALVVWDHGNGWGGSSFDDSSGGDGLTQQEINDALSSIPVEIGLFAYDACLMGMLECAYEVGDHASIFVASEAIVPGNGFPYDDILAALVSQPNMSPADLGSQIVSDYGTHYDYHGDGDETMSSINLESIAQLTAQVSALAVEFINNATTADYDLLADLRDQLYPLGCGTYNGDEVLDAVDLGYLLYNITLWDFSDSIQSAAQVAFDTYFGSTILANYEGDNIWSSGLSIYFPDAGDYNPAYAMASSFTADTAWDEFLVWFGNYSPFQTGGYFNFAQYARFQLLDEGVHLPAPGVTINGLQLSYLFDETHYLAENPDVAAAVHTGYFVSGFDHFAQFGVLEGHDPSLLYDEEYYLTHNPDIAQAVTDGLLNSGLQHFLYYGHGEGRDPSSLFTQADYLTNNPDVAIAIDNGLLQSAFQHYTQCGCVEGRQPDLSLYSEAYYLQHNPDVAAAVASGVLTDGFEHYVYFGQGEGRDPSALFDESAYLANNLDVAAAVTSGLLSSGFDHFITCGRAEGREAIAVV
jgi:hypothetical protein